MSSPPPWAIPVLSICCPHAQQAGPDCTQTRHEAKLAYHGPHLSSLRQNISFTPIVWSACGRSASPRHVDCFPLSHQIHCARKRNFVSARTSIKNFTLASPWKRSARQIRACWPLAVLRVSLHPESLSLGPSAPVSFPVLGHVFFEACARCRLQLFCVPRPVRRSCPALSPPGGWPLSCHARGFQAPGGA